MKRFVTGWLKPTPKKTGKKMSFMSVVYCGSCRQISSVSRLGNPCPKCGASPESVVRANSWDFDNPKVCGLHQGKVEVANG